MKHTMRFSVGGQVVDVPSDELEQFQAAAAQHGATPDEVKSYRVDDKVVSVPDSEYSQFARLAEVNGKKPEAVHSLQMDDGKTLALGDNALRGLIQMRTAGNSISRKALQSAGIPDFYGKSVEDRGKLVDTLAEMFPAEKQSLGVLGTLKAQKEAELGREMGYGETLARSIPFLGSILDATEKGKESNERRLYNGEFRDTLEASRLAKAIGVPEEKIREINEEANANATGYTVFGAPINPDTDLARQRYHDLLQDALIARIQTRAKAGEQLSQNEINFLQKVGVGAVGAGRTIAEMASGPVAAATLGVSAMNRAADLHNGQMTVAANGEVLTSGDDGDTAMLKGFLGATGERLIWMKLGQAAKALPGGGKVADAFSKNWLTQNAGEIGGMVVKQRLTNLLDDVVGLNVRDGEEKKALSDWAKDFVSVSSNAEMLLEMLPIHFAMKGAHRFMPSGREAAQSRKAQREALGKYIDPERLKGMSDTDVNNLYRYITSPHLTEERVEKFMSGVAADMKRGGSEAAIDKDINAASAERIAARKAEAEAAAKTKPDGKGKMEPVATTEGATNETRNGADEAPAKPAEGTAGEPKVGEAADAKAAEQARGEAPREGVVEQGKSPAAAAPSAETPAKPVEATSRASDEGVQFVRPGSKQNKEVFDTFTEGRRFVESASGRLVEQRMIDPKSVLNGNDKNSDWVRANLLENKTWDEVVNMPSTQKYIQMYKDGTLAPPANVIVMDNGKLRSLNRRRIVAAIEAGVAKIPANVETGERIPQETLEKFQQDASTTSVPMSAFTKPAAESTEGEKARASDAAPVPDGKGKMKKRKGKKAKAEEPPPPAEEQTAPAETAATESLRETIRTDPELLRIDAAWKTAKTDAERNALKARFDARVEEIKAAQTQVKPTERAETDPLAPGNIDDTLAKWDAERRESANKVKLSSEAIADIKDWMEKNPDGDFTHDGMQKIFDAEMERVKAANGGVRPGDVMPTLDAISVAYKDMKAASRTEAEGPSTYTPAKELVEAKDRIEAMPTDSKSQKDAKKKAQKDWLLSSVDDAIKSHAEAAAPEGAPPTEKFVDDYEALLKRRNATYDRKKLGKIHEQIDKARETFQKGEMITFDVPDNGTFKVYNNPEALTLFKRLVQKRLSPTSLKEGTIVAAEKPLANDIETSGVGEKVAEGEKPAAAPKAKGDKRLKSVNPEGDLPDIPDLDAKTPEQEISERLDLKRLDPKRRSDPKVLAWAKKNGRNVTNGMVTPDAVRAYDESMTENTGRLAKRWFPDTKIVAHKYGENIKRGQHVLEQRIDDPATIAELEKDTVSRLRSMQLRDGKLYPPMAGKVKSGETGKAEWQEPSEPGIWYRADEHPELLDKDGKFTLIKGNGEQIKAAYNPYWHMSKTALNDQFSSAYKRPELVTVEVSAPRSEAEAKRGEGYWATGAKDPVGETKWPKGPVSGQLAKAGAPERKVTLTRHNKIVRVLPTEEVADRIKAEIDACPRKDVTVEVPFNCVTPQLRDALVERGVKIGKPARLSGAALKEANTAYKNWKAESDAISNLEKNWYRSRTAASVEEAASIVKSAGIVNKPLSNEALGIKDAIITGNNLSEMKNEKAVKKSRSPRLHAIAVANIDKLFETAFTKLTHPDTHGRKEVTQAHRLGSLMKDPQTGNYEPVMITVLEYEKYGHRIYTVEAVDVLKYKTPAGQLVDSALPAITPRLQEFVNSLANKAVKVNGGADIRYLRDTAGRTLGWFDPKSKEVHLLPGADPKAVAHEIMWHGTRDYVSQLAAKGDARAQKWLDMMHDVERNAPQQIKDIVNRLYARAGQPVSADTLMNEYGAWFTMGKGGEALEKALQKAENRNWFAKAFYTVKEMFKDFLTAHGRNRVDLAAIDGMTRDEFVDFLSKEFAGGKTLGHIKGPQQPMISTKETFLGKYKRKVYDQNAAVRDLERDVEKKTGKKISADDSVEAANALKHGLKEAANIEIQGKMAEFRKTLSETGIHHADLEYYAALKAAAGRDAKIDARNIANLKAKMGVQGKSQAEIDAAVNAYKSTNGSHIDPREAKKMLAEIENGPDAAKYKQAYDAMRKVIDETLDVQQQAGLVSAEEVKQWRAEEPNYIPFKNEYDAETGEWLGRGTSRNFTAPEHHAAKGRQSAAGDILAHIFMDHQLAKHRAIENAVRQKLAALVKANPELGKVEILPKDAVRNVEKDDPNVVVFKQNGRAYAIHLEGTRGAAVANAFTQRNQWKMDWADKGFQVYGKKISFRNFAHWSAGMATRYSPTFAVRNTLKDNIELANIIYSERGPIAGSKFMGQYIANRARMAKTLGSYITTGKIDTSTAEGKILDRYIKAGGLIAGGTRAEAFSTIKESLSPEAIAKEMKRGNSKIRAVGKHAIKSIAYLNEYAEMATRLGIFSTEVKAGKSDAEAALFSRRATVDFNRHGDYTPGFNLFRLFSNSTLGASARAAAALTKSKYGAVAGVSMFAWGLGRAFLDHFANADEDKERAKLGKATGKDMSEYERRTSLFYLRRGDNLYKVAQHESPFSLITYAGDCVGRWILGEIDGKQVAKNLGVSAAEVAYNFLPMGSVNLTSRNGGFTDDMKAALVSGVCPTVLQPIAELAWNMDYAGRTIYNEPYPGDTSPRSSQGRDSTPDWAKDAAVKLNEATRAEGHRKGYFDIPPEAIQKLLEGYGKNAMRDISMALSVGEAIAKGDLSMLDPRNTPIKRDFVRPLDGNDARFNEARKEFEANRATYKEERKDMTPEERAAYKEQFPHLRRAQRGNELLADIKKLRKMEKGFWYKTGKATPHEWPQEKIDEFKARRRKKQAEFLKEMGKQ